MNPPSEQGRSYSLDDADDRTLAGRAADGDVRAFEVLVRRYGPMMRAYATRILGSSTDSDDIVQEAFIAAWKRLPTLDDGSVVKSWLMRIVSHKSIDLIRANRTHDDIDDHEPEAPDEASPEQRAVAKSREDALSAVLATLPAAQRQCWVLHEIGRYSYDDIARELDLPTSTVRGLLARARKKLILEMEDWR